MILLVIIKLVARMLVVLMLHNLIGRTDAVLLQNKFTTFMNGSTGELTSPPAQYQTSSVFGCGGACLHTPQCWAWAYDEDSSSCKVYFLAVQFTHTGNPSTFRTYGLASQIVLGYFIPATRVQSWMEGKNMCINSGTTIAYEENAAKMLQIHDKIGERVIFIDLRREASGSDSWVTGNNVAVDYNSVNWEDGEPDDVSETATLSVDAEVADIDENSVLDPYAPVLCALP